MTKNVATATRNSSKIQTAIWRSFKLLNERNSRNVFQRLETMACPDSGHFCIQTIYVCLCEKAKSANMEMKRHNTIGDGVNIVFCPQINVPKCSLSFVIVCAATAGVCLAWCLREGRLYPLSMAKTDSFNNQWLLYVPPSLTLHIFPIWCICGFRIVLIKKMYRRGITTDFEEAKVKVFHSTPQRSIGGLAD
jgi:hypothetical protein